MKFNCCSFNLYISYCPHEVINLLIKVLKYCIFTSFIYFFTSTLFDQWVKNLLTFKLQPFVPQMAKVVLVKEKLWPNISFPDKQTLCYVCMFSATLLIEKYRNTSFPASLSYVAAIFKYLLCFKHIHVLSKYLTI